MTRSIHILAVPSFHAGLLVDLVRTGFPTNKVASVATLERLRGLVEIDPQCVVVMGVESTETRTVDFVRDIKGRHPECRIVAIIQHDYSAFRDEVIGAGCREAVSVDRIHDELIQAIRTAMGGDGVNQER